MKTDNELIAEFMGIDVHDYELFGKQVRCYSIKSNDSVEVALNRHHVDTLKYHISFDCLIDVVQKIESVINDYHNQDDVPLIYWRNVFDGYINTNINITYDSVIGFIKWYNSQDY